MIEVVLLASTLVVAPASLSAPALAASPTQVTLKAAPTRRAELRAAVEKFLGSPEHRRVDPTFPASDPASIDIAFFRPGDGLNAVVRVRPSLGGVDILGADRVFSLRQGVLSMATPRPISPSGTFVKTAAEAEHLASAALIASLLRDHKGATGLAARRWLVIGPLLRPVWKVRVPTLALADLADVYVDADSGTVLRIEPVARFAQPTAARAFVHAPDPSGVDVADLTDVTLADLRDDDLGDHLRGHHMETYNCCKRYTCPGGGDACLPEERLCAADDDASANVSRIKTQFDTSLLGLPFGVRWIESVFCAELPKAVSQAAQGPNPDGWFYTPVDTDRGGGTPSAEALASETDAFAEVQVYQATWSYFSHVRSVLDDPGFCLGQVSMSCDDDGDSLDENGGKTTVTGLAPVRPYHITTNLLLPAVDFASLGPQFLAGKGLTENDPLLIDDFQRLDNAAFVPALEEGPIEIPEELKPIADIFNRPYDSNLYMQGARDFAYDGDIVYHEFTHALVHTLVPGLGSSGFDVWGSHVEPGAMNEGWSDYFSASFTESSPTGEYGGAGLTDGELGLRNADNDYACPDVIEGEVHQDAQHFTGALWEVRDLVIAGFGAAAVPAYDRVLLAALAQSDSDESMATQAGRIVALLELDPNFDSALATAADGVFRARGLIDCERAFQLIAADGTLTVRPRLAQPSPGEVGLVNMAPSIAQFLLELPPGTLSFELRWGQGGGGFGGLGGGGGTTPLSVLVHQDTPVRWDYEASINPVGIRAVPRNDAGEEIPFDPADATVRATINGSTSTYSLGISPDLCAPRVFYVSLVSTAEAAALSNISLTTEKTDVPCYTPPVEQPEAGCDCRSSGASGAWLGLAALGLLLRRRRTTP